MATKLASRKRPVAKAAPRRRGTSPTVIKLRQQLKSSRTSATRRVKKARTGHVLTQLATAAVAGAMARRGIDLPFADEVGTDAIAAVLFAGAGWHFRNDTLMSVGQAFAVLATHEAVEDSPLFGFLDPQRE